MRHFAGIVFLKLGLSGCLLLGFQAYSQDIPVGTWRTHFSYNNGRILEKTSDKIFCAVENGLFSVDLSDNSIRKLSKIDGLSDVGVSAMKYNSDENTLVIGYRSGLVDFISDDGISTLQEVALSNLDGSKTINDIAFFQSRTFLATELGIVVVSNDETTILENFTQIGEGGAEVRVSEIEILGDVLFAKTNFGLQNGNLTNNLLDFNNWNHHTATDQLTELTAVNDELFALNGQDLHRFGSDLWTDGGIDLPNNASKLYSVEAKLMTATSQSLYELQGSSFEEIASIVAQVVNDIDIVNGEYLVADGLLGLQANESNLSPSGPLFDQYSRLRVIDNTAYGFHAPSPETYDGSIKVDGYSVFAEGAWSTEQVSNFLNVSDIGQYQGVTYLSSIGDGLLDQNSGEIIDDIPQSDSSLDTVIATLGQRQHLWVSSFSSTDPIHQFDGDQWTSFSATLLLDDKFTSISTSQTGIFWGSTSTGRMIVFDPEEMRAFALNAIPGQLQDFEISIEDDAWIATSNGPTTNPDASFIFQDDQLILPTFEGRVLFEGEQINVIETDGGNRVWFGTERGLWVFSENTSEQVAQFNIDNSPLPSDNVLDLAYNEENGEMFIATDMGLVSYRSASSVGSVAHQNVNIFPNPVSPDYVGLIGIEGLGKNTSVKITDINGNLVKELNANGSSASWDMKNVANQEVVTGVYLIFSSDPEGVETYVGKIAVIR